MMRSFTLFANNGSEPMEDVCLRFSCDSIKLIAEDPELETLEGILDDKRGIVLLVAVVRTIKLAKQSRSI